VKFELALAAMREGKKVHRDGWIKDDYIHIALGKILCVGLVVREAVFESGILHNDWEIYEEPKNPLTFYEALKIVRGRGRCESILETDKAMKRQMFLVGDYVEFSMNGKFASNKIYNFDIDAEWYEV